MGLLGNNEDGANGFGAPGSQAKGENKPQNANAGAAAEGGGYTGGGGGTPGDTGTGNAGASPGTGGGGGGGAGGFTGGNGTPGIPGMAGSEGGIPGSTPGSSGMAGGGLITDSNELGQEPALYQSEGVEWWKVAQGYVSTTDYETSAVEIETADLDLDLFRGKNISSNAPELVFATKVQRYIPLGVPGFEALMGFIGKSSTPTPMRVIRSRIFEQQVRATNVSLFINKLQAADPDGAYTKALEEKVEVDTKISEQLDTLSALQAAITDIENNFDLVTAMPQLSIEAIQNVDAALTPLEKKVDAGLDIFGIMIDRMGFRAGDLSKASTTKLLALMIVMLRRSLNSPTTKTLGMDNVVNPDPFKVRLPSTPRATQLGLVEKLKGQNPAGAALETSDILTQLPASVDYPWKVNVAASKNIILDDIASEDLFDPTYELSSRTGIFDLTMGEYKMYQFNQFHDFATKMFDTQYSGIPGDDKPLKRLGALVTLLSRTLTVSAGIGALTNTPLGQKYGSSLADPLILALGSIPGATGGTAETADGVDLIQPNTINAPPNSLLDFIAINENTVAEVPLDQTIILPFEATDLHGTTVGKKLLSGFDFFLRGPLMNPDSDKFSKTAIESYGVEFGDATEQVTAYVEKLLLLHEKDHALTPVMILIAMFEKIMTILNPLASADAAQLTEQQIANLVVAKAMTYSPIVKQTLLQGAFVREYVANGGPLDWSSSTAYGVLQNNLTEIGRHPDALKDHVLEPSLASSSSQLKHLIETVLKSGSSTDDIFVAQGDTNTNWHKLTAGIENAGHFTQVLFDLLGIPFIGGKSMPSPTGAMMTPKVEHDESGGISNMVKISRMTNFELTGVGSAGGEIADLASDTAISELVRSLGADFCKEALALSQVENPEASFMDEVRLTHFGKMDQSRLHAIILECFSIIVDVFARYSCFGSKGPSFGALDMTGGMHAPGGSLSMQTKDGGEIVKVQPNDWGDYYATLLATFSKMGVIWDDTDGDGVINHDDIKAQLKASGMPSEYWEDGNYSSLYFAFETEDYHYDGQAGVKIPGGGAFGQNGTWMRFVNALISTAKTNGDFSTLFTPDGLPSSVEGVSKLSEIGNGVSADDMRSLFINLAAETRTPKILMSALRSSAGRTRTNAKKLGAMFAAVTGATVEGEAVIDPGLDAKLRDMSATKLGKESLKALTPGNIALKRIAHDYLAKKSANAVSRAASLSKSEIRLLLGFINNQETHFPSEVGAMVCNICLPNGIISRMRRPSVDYGVDEDVRPDRFTSIVDVVATRYDEARYCDGQETIVARFDTDLHLMADSFDSVDDALLGTGNIDEIAKQTLFARTNTDGTLTRVLGEDVYPGEGDQSYSLPTSFKYAPDHILRNHILDHCFKLLALIESSVDLRDWDFKVPDQTTGFSARIPRVSPVGDAAISAGLSSPDVPIDPTLATVYEELKQKEMLYGLETFNVLDSNKRIELTNPKSVPGGFDAIGNLVEYTVFPPQASEVQLDMLNDIFLVPELQGHSRHSRVMNLSWCDRMFAVYVSPNRFLNLASTATLFPLGSPPQPSTNDLQAALGEVVGFENECIGDLTLYDEYTGASSPDSSASGFGWKWVNFFNGYTFFVRLSNQ